jgi:probable H4MPT-linked C1 transfer pathway protein
VVQLHTPLWRGLEHLDRAMEALAARFALRDYQHRVTMTGELVDRFATRAEGVEALIGRCRVHLGEDQTAIYAGPKGLVPLEAAFELQHWVASANWHASAALVGSRLENALLVDIGSTTSDIVAVRSGRPGADGWSDRERMMADELVYTGVVRTPLCALAERAPFDGGWVGLAAESFATTADVYRLTGELPAHADLGESADGRGKGAAESVARLARMLGEDAVCGEPHQWRSLARYLRQCQVERIWRACARRCSAGLSEDAPLVGAGVGRFLVPELARRLGRDSLDWLALIGQGEDEVSAGADAGDCAPASALALLSPAELGDGAA